MGPHARCPSETLAGESTHPPHSRRQSLGWGEGLFTGLAIPCRGGKSSAPRGSKRAFSTIAKEILTAYCEANPFDAVELGLHRYGGRVMDLRPASMERRVARIDRDLEILDRHEAAGGPPERRLEIGVLRSRLLKERFGLADSRWPRESPSSTVGAINLVEYLLREYAPVDARLRSATKLQARVPHYLEVLRQITTRRLAETQYEVGEMAVSGIIESYRDELPPFLDRVSPATRRRIERTNAEALAALSAFRDELRAKYKPRVRKAFAIGRRKYERMLWAEHLAKLPIERLLEVGEADLGANKRAFVETAATVAPGKDPRDTLRVIADHHPTAESLVPDTQEMLEDIRAFLIDHDVVTVPSEERPIVIETPRFARLGTAAMNAPGPFEKVAKESFYWITPVEKDWPPEKREEWLRMWYYPYLRNASVHECYPGHFVHVLHRRYCVRSPLLKSSFSYAFTEGWAHYTEEMMIEVGFQDGDPKYRMAQLQDALVRDCRYVSSIRMHVYGWSWEDATRFFMENAFMDRLPAEQEAKRGTFDPGYLNYTLGKLMIMKLRKDWMALHPEASLREFHDAFLSLGAPPLGLAREALLGPGAGPAL